MRLNLTSTLTLCLALAACGGNGSDSPTPGGVGVGMPDPTPDPTSGLSHTGTRVPAGTAAQQSGPAEQFSAIGKAKAEALAEDLGIIFEVVENHGSHHLEDCAAAGAEFDSCAIVNLHLKDSTASLNTGEWKLYFHSVKRVLRVDSDEFTVVHINGDLNYLAPTTGFTGFDSEPVKTIKLITEFSFLLESEFMPRYWLVRNGTVSILPNTDTETDVLAFATDINADNSAAFVGETNPVANSQNRFDKYAPTQNLEDFSDLIIPTPRNVTVGNGAVALGSGLAFDNTVLSAASVDAITSRLATFHSANGAALPVSTSTSSSLGINEYQLVVDANGISISGYDDQAVYYGAQSLLSLVTPGSDTLPYIDVVDSPRFDFRGMHLDVARNFHSVASVKKLIDQMSAYKMNKLHMHLSDDEGWRLEIPELPELTSVGGTRKFQVDQNGQPTETTGLLPQLGSGPGTTNQGTGFYTRSEFIELLQYAAARYVQVIPEFDMPGHARAAVVAMRARANNLGTPASTDIRLDDPADSSVYLTVQHFTDSLINPCVEGTYNFMSTLVNQVNAMYMVAGVTLDIWHMGGDEAKSVYKGDGFPQPGIGDFPWEKSPVCQALLASNDSLNSLDDLTPWFISRISQIVNNAGIESLYAYQDILRNVQRDDIATTKAGVGYWDILWRGGYSEAYAWPALGYETIVSVPDYLYFDFPHEVDPKERGTSWATRMTDMKKVFSFAPENLPQNAETSVSHSGLPFEATGDLPPADFKGMQGQLWSEMVRTPEQFDYMIFPRLLALAERAWHRADWEETYTPNTTYNSTTQIVDKNSLAADWSRFANAIGKKELAKLDAADVSYRVPTAGASPVAGTISMNTEYPGLDIEYSQDGTNWQTYTPLQPPTSATAVRTRSASGNRAGRETTVP